MQCVLNAVNLTIHFTATHSLIMVICVQHSVRVVCMKHEAPRWIVCCYSIMSLIRTFLALCLAHICMSQMIWCFCCCFWFCLFFLSFFSLGFCLKPANKTLLDSCQMIHTNWSRATHFELLTKFCNVNDLMGTKETNYN